MFDLSLDWANAIYGWSNVLLIVASIAVVAGTIGVFWAGSIRDRYAEERASKNEADTALAKSTAATANEGAAKAQERTKMVELAVEQQRERAAKAEKELLVLKERQKERRLTPAQRTNLVTVWSGTEKGDVSIDFMAADGESEAFARDIADALKASGWTVTRVGPLVPVGISAPIGLRLLVRDRETPLVKGLISGFDHIGIRGEVVINPKANPPVQLWVGTKP
jgi:hypothetical protein